MLHLRNQMLESADRNRELEAHLAAEPQRREDLEWELCCIIRCDSELTGIAMTAHVAQLNSTAIEL